MSETTLLSVAQDNGNFTILIEVAGILDGAFGTGLVAALSGEADDVTVFAPTDDAFIALAPQLGFPADQEATVENVKAFYASFDGGTLEVLRDVVLYHVVDGKTLAAEVDGLDTVETLLGAEIDLSKFSLLTGNTILGDIDPDNVNPRVIIPNLEAEGGVIHVVDKVLLPIDIAGNEVDLPSITETVIALSGPSGFDDNGGDFDFLRESVIAADLAGTLDSDEVDLTVFAPTDAAFLGLSQALGYEGADEAGGFTYLVDALRLLNKGEDPIPLLKTVLEYHVSAGSQTLETVAANGSVQTLVPGASLTVDGLSLVDADPDIANPSLVFDPELGPVTPQPFIDVQASNGLIHVIDGVLLPIDVLQSNGANDVDFFIGDDGRDRINTGADNDFIDGKGGRDHIAAGSGDDVVLAGAGRDYVNGGSGNDYILGEGGSDRLFGGWGDDFIDGGDGRDMLSGGSGNDVLEGGAGRDRLSGGFGDDTLAGGEGDDRLFGGFGEDTFVFEENGGDDKIIGFVKGRDKIDLTAYEFEDFSMVKDAMSGRFLKTEIDLGDTEITVFGPFFFGLGEDDFIL